MENPIDKNEIEKKDTTNWKAWYWGLIIFLAIQITLYLFITNLYAV